MQEKSPSRISFRHNDIEHLKNRLANSSAYADRFICIESIYSTDGSIAPLTEICQLAREYEAYLIVDEAHAVGVCGPKGCGLVAEKNLADHVFAQIITFGKALGVYGAIILGSFSLKQSLVNFATSCIYTTALPFLTLAAIKCSYDLFPEMDLQRSHLQRLVQKFRKFHPSTSKTHIQPIPIQGNRAVKKVAQRIVNQGFDVKALMSPTVRRGREVIRICLHAFNTDNELAQLVKCLYRSLFYG